MAKGEYKVCSWDTYFKNQYEFHKALAELNEMIFLSNKPIDMNRVKELLRQIEYFDEYLTNFCPIMNLEGLVNRLENEINTAIKMLENMKKDLDYLKDIKVRE